MSDGAHAAGSELARLDVAGAALVVVAGDLTAQDVDVVVNAANERLQHGGGVARALVEAGGPVVQRESDGWVDAHGPLEPGQAALTSAGSMPARSIAHVVGPRHRRGQDNEGLLREAVDAALEAAGQQGRSVALPAISSGIFGYPPAEAGRVIADAAHAWLQAHQGVLDEVRLVGFDETAAHHFAAGLPT